MKKIEIPKDDIDDILELSQKLESTMHDILEDNALHIALSASFRAFSNLMLSQSENLFEFMQFRNAMITYFDITIEHILNQKK